ncbi:MAG TPA: hypothetical protein VNO26_04545, partial [Candidatus Limnocylindria bacterium]|nr:hypothetical protein [Candidatus Limnocylindria bacterium]
PAVEPPPQAVARVRPAEKAPKAPAASQQAAATPPSPPPQVAEALELFLDMPILENMEKLQNFDAIRTVDLGDERQEERRG